MDGAVTRYIRGINLIEADDAGTKKYYLYNAHGDVVQLANSTGQLLWTYDYDAFGVEKDPQDGDTNPWRYCGEYWDSETGTCYLRARNYNPTIGCFLSEDTHWNPGNMVYGDNPVKWNERRTGENDPLGLNTCTYVPNIAAIIQSGNLYVYGMNNPLMYVDPTGELSLSLVHNWVVADIHGKYALADMTSNKMIDYSGFGFGFADLVNTTTGEVLRSQILRVFGRIFRKYNFSNLFGVGR